MATRYGLKTPQAVWAWRDRGEIPPKYYLAMTADLAALGCEAPASVWGMVEEAAHDAAA
ncbi:hypothetical protein MAXJ12_08639 [Mesorhizobium alhagi CCNWXJ12-2]|uniref:Uncharacterized protein n=1 Tax=Mesorhizobium alhagi CCNWXJ12-2 TaxID=1107882 RepID=H0HNK5_9HYPH|nr:hypothetical protein MAXJ12_08639 [Mesorhizobium alhagi CCNWXJ12-2]